MIKGRHRDLEIDTTVKSQSSAADQSRKQCCNHACQLHYPPIWTLLPGCLWSSRPLRGFSSVTGRCPLSPSTRPSVPFRHPSLPTRGPPSIALEEKAQCQEKGRRFSPDLDGRTTGATLARRNLVWSWTPVLRRSLHHQQHEQGHQSPHYCWDSYHCSHFCSAPVELSHTPA